MDLFSPGKLNDLCLHSGSTQRDLLPLANHGIIYTIICYNIKISKYIHSSPGAAYYRYHHYFPLAEVNPNHLGDD